LQAGHQPLDRIFPPPGFDLLWRSRIDIFDPFGMAAPAIGFAFDQGGTVTGPGSVDGGFGGGIDCQHIVAIHNHTRNTVSGGPGGYMVIVQVDDLATERQRVEQLGVRVAWEIDLGQAATVHLHPRDLGGALLSLDQMTPPASWEWGGPGWEQRRGEGCVSGIRAVVIQADDPATMAKRWGEVLARPVSAQADGYAVTLDEGRVIFVSIDRERAVKGEGIIGMELATDHAPGVLEAARECGLPVEDNMLQLAGVDFRLVR